MQSEKKLSKSETVRAIVSSVRFTLQNSPWLLALLTVEEVVSRLVPFINAWLIAHLITLLPHLVRNPANQHQATLYVLYIAAATIAPAIFDNFGNNYRSRQRVELDLKIERKLQTAFSSLPFAMYEDKRIMDAYDRASRFSRSLSGFVVNRLRNMFGAVLALTIATIAFWHFSPWLTIGIFILTIPALWVELRMQALREQTWRNNTINYRKASAYEVTLNPRMIKESRLLGLVRMAIDQSQHYRRKAELAQVKVEMTSNKYRIASTAIETVLEVVVLLQVLRRIVTGALAVGQFVFIQQLINQYLGALRETSWLVQDLDDLLFGVAEYTEITSTLLDVQGAALKDAAQDIHVNSLSFKYPQTEAWALQDISLTIPAGKTIAIVGENGAGKTTLIKLLMRLYDPKKGSVTIGDQNLHEVNSADWHKNLAVLFQDFQMFYDFTIRDNVWFGDTSKSADDPQLEASLRAADAWEFASKLPHGLDTYLGKFMDEENGTDLSGGQAQRLAIARTLFRDPAILVLDEPTSAIDAKAEYEIFRNIEAARNGRTTILISHRFSTVRKASYIYVLEKGRLKEQGTHEELMKQKGLYHEMFSKQAEGYK